MKRRLVIFTSITFIAVFIFWLSFGRESADAVRVQFIGMTNDPSVGRAALFCVTNQTGFMIFCGRVTTQVHSSSGWRDIEKRSFSGLAYLAPGESHVFAAAVPRSPEPWRAPVWWRREALTHFEIFVNRQIGQLLPLFGKLNVHRDPWVPFEHVVYSPEVAQ